MRYFFILWIVLGTTGVQAKEKALKQYKKPTQAELKQKLSCEQFDVTQKDATERPFDNKYWNNKEPGIYVDVATGEPLFSSLDKFDSGTGWPSFTKPLEAQNIEKKEDMKFGMKRVEVRSKHGDSHLGHVFDDGPGPSGLRYCINSASLRFIPVDKLEEEGYGEYMKLFKKDGAKKDAKREPQSESKKKDPKAKAPAGRQIATFAGGCFWGIEEIVRKLDGVIDTKVGYTGGLLKSPTYNEVKKGQTGHAEAVQVTFDPAKISYEELLGYFFRLHDPTTVNRQGNDIGSQYRSAIFFHDEEQKKTAETVKEKVNASGKWKKPIVTEIVKATEFYPAEDYHQDYLQKNPGGYTCHYLRD